MTGGRNAGAEGKTKRRKAHQGKEEKLVRLASLRENDLIVYLPERTGILMTWPGRSRAAPLNRFSVAMSRTEVL